MDCNSNFSNKIKSYGDEIRWFAHSNESYCFPVVLFTVMLYKVVLTFEAAYETI